MSDKLDKPLEDLIAASRKDRSSSGGRRGRGRGALSGRQNNTRSAPYEKPRRDSGNAEGDWHHDRFQGEGNGNGGNRRVADARSSIGSAKILISNLDAGVTDQDIQDIFSSVGTVRKAFVHYDRSGRSVGTAEVTFGNAAGARDAIAKYNNVPLDGKPMQIAVVGGAPAVDARPPRANRPERGTERGTERAERGARPAGGRGGRGGRGERVKRERATPKTAEELDAELDSYRTQASAETEATA
eukprot:Opistho-2@7912